MPKHQEMMEAPSAPAMTLWGSDNPAEVIKRASKVATVLAEVVNSRKMFTMIGQGKHLRVEAWQTLGAMTGVYPVVAWTRKLENGWEARVEARTKDGDLVGAAESECLNKERNWANKDDHSLRSMAQTRATSKALSMPLRFIVALAGYEGTPAEEMPQEQRPSDAFRRPQQREDGSKPKDAPQNAGNGGSRPAAPPPTDAAPPTWTGLVEKVTFREYVKKDAQGKPTGEKGKTYSIVTKDGKVFKTWSDTFATDCKYAAENDEKMTITYSVSEFRGQQEFKVETCVPAAISDPDDTSGEAPPGEEGPETEA